MFDIQIPGGGDATIKLVGRLDASQSDRALKVLSTLPGPVVADCSELDYISSAGIGVLLETYKRLHDEGHSFRLLNVPPRVKNVLTLANIDRILGVE